MRKGQFRAIFVFGLLAVFSIVAAPKLPELMTATGMATGGEPIQELKIEAANMNSMALTGGGLEFELTVPVENPNQVPAEINRINYTAYLNDSQIAEGSIQEGTTIPAGSEEEITRDVDAEVSSVEEGLSILNRESDIRVEGQLYTDIGPATLVTSFETE